MKLFFTLLKAIAKSNKNFFISITLQGAIKERSNERIPNIIERRLGAITLQKAIKKSPTVYIIYTIYIYIYLHIYPSIYLYVYHFISLSPGKRDSILEEYKGV